MRKSILSLFIVLLVTSPAKSQAITKGEIDRAVTKQVQHGSYVQYVPGSVTPQSTLMVICHGVFSKGTAKEAAKRIVLMTGFRSRENID